MVGCPWLHGDPPAYFRGPFLQFFHVAQPGALVCSQADQPLRHPSLHRRSRLFDVVVDGGPRRWYGDSNAFRLAPRSALHRSQSSRPAVRWNNGSTCRSTREFRSSPGSLASWPRANPSHSPACCWTSGACWSGFPSSRRCSSLGRYGTGISNWRCYVSLNDSRRAIGAKRLPNFLSCTRMASAPAQVGSASLAQRGDRAHDAGAPTVSRLFR